MAGSDAVAIVIGGSYGTGRELAVALARHRCAVVVVYLDDQRRAEAAVEELFAAGGCAVAVRADVTDDLDVERLFNETAAAFGVADVVVDTTPGNASSLLEHAARRGIAVIGSPDAAAGGLESARDARRPRVRVPGQDERA